jgi:hypothetical protein
VLWRSRGAWLVLKDCAMLKPNHEPLPMDGDVVIHRDRIAFIQVLP